MAAEAFVALLNFYLQPTAKSLYLALMHRFYLPDAGSQNSLVISDREAHHAVNVLRIRKGETVVVLNGRGCTLDCEVADVSKKTVVLNVRQKLVSPAPACRITLFQAIPKGKLLDQIIQKATELGVHRIVPLMTERVISQLDEERGEDKREKWQQVAIEAIKQCGQPWLPTVESPKTLKEVFAGVEPRELSLIASLQPDTKHPRAIFSKLRENKLRVVHASVWVGPEGDFTPAEVQGIVAYGATPITLGPLVLRCETAAIYCLSIMNYELQETQASERKTP